MDYAIVTDSASDLPENIKEKYKVKVIPTPVVINGETFYDGETISTDKFYDMLEDKKNQISTFHINPHMFEEAFTEFAEKSMPVIYLCFSTGIAATNNAAHLAKEELLKKYPHFELTIIDSKGAAIGFGLMVYKLLQMQSNGAPKELIIEAASFYVKHIRYIFTVKTLKYLVKSGRLSSAKGLVAETLKIKPLLTVDENGSLKTLKQVRGQENALKSVAEYVRDNQNNIESQTLAIAHSSDTEMLEAAKKVILELVTPKEIFLGEVGCAIGTHTGRGLVVVCFLDTSEEKYKQYLD